MWVCKIEVWPYGDHTKPVETLRLIACNDGTGTLSHGNYHVAIARDVPDEDSRWVLRDAMERGETIQVKAWPRGNRHDNLLEDQSHLTGLVSEVLAAHERGEKLIIHGE